MKNHFTALLLTTSLAGAATTVRAQTVIQFGPRLGVNLSTSSNSGTPSDFNEATKSIVGVQVGGTLSVGITDKFSFQPSLLYSQKGMESTGSQTDRSDPHYATIIKASATIKLNYFELPFNFVYAIGGAEGFQLFAGPYVAVGVGGSGSYKVNLNSNNPQFAQFNGDYPGSLTVEFADKQDDNSTVNNNSSTPTIIVTTRRFDAGFNAGIGYRVGPFQAQLGYGLGLINSVPKDSDGNDTGSKSYHRVLHLSANYFLGGK